MSIAVIGPSHAKQLEMAIATGDLKVDSGTYVKGFKAAPIYTEPILNEVRKCSNFDVIYLYVTGSLRFNFLHQQMKQRFLVSTKRYELGLQKKAFLFDRNLLSSTEVVATMDQHLQLWLDFYASRFPQVRFIFWCDFISTWRKARRFGVPKTAPRNMYHDWAKRNPNHVDLEAFVKRTGLTIPDLVQRNDPHKNARGRKLFMEYLLSETKAQ